MKTKKNFCCILLLSSFHLCILAQPVLINQLKLVDNHHPVYYHAVNVSKKQDKIQENRYYIAAPNGMDSSYHWASDSASGLQAIVAKRVFTYKNHNLVNQVNYKWENNSWAPIKKFNAFYNSTNKLLNLLIHTWDGNSWLPERNENYAYDARGNRLLWIIQLWDGASWINKEQYHYAYDLSNNLIEEQFQQWQATDWVNVKQFFSVFDSQQNEINSIIQTWDGAAWVNEYQFNWLYDSMDNMIHVLIQSWLTDKWENLFQYNETYELHNMTSSTQQNWMDSAWVNDSRSVFNYDLNNNNIDRTDQLWMDTVWTNESKDVFLYDGANNNIQLTSQQWEGNTWINRFQTVSEFNALNKQISRQNKKWYLEDWKKLDSAHFYYNEPTGIKKEMVAKTYLTVYPNPFKETLTFLLTQDMDHPSIFIYDILGKQQGKIDAVAEKKIIFNRELLPNGIYFYKVMNKEQVIAVGKIIAE